MNALGDWSAMLYTASTWIVPVLLAITLHEAAHGFVALRFGDDTALILLRSPFLFGYAKPVPVNFGRLRHPRRDMVWVAAAGPAMNVLLAILSALLFYTVEWFPVGSSRWVAENLVHSIQLNAVLCVFNMLPLPPLDGGRVAVGILPNALAFPLARLEPYGIPILLLVLFVLPLIGTQAGYDLNLVGPLIAAPTRALIELVLTITGQGS